MRMSPTRTQLVVGLLAVLPLVPVTLYILNQSTAYVALSLVSVLLVAASLYLMFSPTEGSEHGAV
jgi:NADH:ubiquinone oxidoreductase subunit 6 (subunit J)